VVRRMHRPQERCRVLSQQRRERSTEIQTPHGGTKSSDEVQATRVVAALLSRDVLISTHTSTVGSRDQRRQSGRPVRAPDPDSREGTRVVLRTLRPVEGCADATEVPTLVSAMAIDPDGDAA
jgi:hypothetical protein